MALQFLAGSSLPKRAIVIAPHADDEVLGAGGLIALLAEAGWEVYVGYLTISGYPSAAKGDHPDADTREQEVRDALAILGAVGDYRVLFRGEDKHLRLDTVAQADLITFIEEGIRTVRPSLLVMPCRGHYHQDHRATAEACVAAMRPAPHGARPLVPLVLAYGHAHGGWGGTGYNFHPSVFVDITDVMERKIQALAAYVTQLCDPPHARSLQALKDQAGMWGAFAGVSYAEPFECLRLLL